MASRRIPDGLAGSIIVSRRATLAMLSSTAALAACGGGGGNSTPVPAPTPTPPPPPPPPPPPVNGPPWFGYGHDAQHTAVSQIASQDLNKISWSLPVDDDPQYRSDGALVAHYGSPVVSAKNTVIYGRKTSATGDFVVTGRNGANGNQIWSMPTDYVMPPHNWLPPYNVLLTQQGHVCAPAIGGTILVRDDANAASATPARHAFYGTYSAADYDGSVFINTPLTADSNGNLFFGFVVTGANPAGLVSGIARLAPDGTGTWVGAAAAAGDATIVKPTMNCAPALSHDEALVYIAVNSNAAGQPGYLLALDSTTLATKAKANLIDPNTGTRARESDDGTAAPVVGKDGRVFYGVLETTFPSHNARGWLLQFDKLLNSAGPPGSFGWDVSPSVIPATMVPSYAGSSTYLLALKYNNYSGVGSGDGLNRLAILDPKGTQADSITPSVTVMKEVLTVLAPTKDGATSNSRKEWCINTMAADPKRKSMLANCEDGILYRWDLTSNTLSQSIRLTDGLGEAYTPTLIGADGAVYAINNAKLFSVRKS
jgi:hypothetical protein